MEPRKKHGRPFRIAVVLIVMPVLYVLSAGPAYAMLLHNVIPPSCVSAVLHFYGPLNWLRIHSTAVDLAVGWYISLWK